MTIVYLWRVQGFGILRAIHQMGFARFFLKFTPGVRFSKSIGTGTGKRFTPSDANPFLWGLIVVVDDPVRFDNSKVVRQWRRFAVAEKRYLLHPLSSHGQWAGKEPFIIDGTVQGDGKIAAITRARIAWRKNFLFWSAVPPVTKSLHEQPGLEMAIGIGEAPIGLQGTFSLWKDAKSLRDFAYKGEAHAGAIEATQRHRWYSEELFARFAVLEERGSI
ncbi:MAG: hypothetical protein RL414_293 [Actinomycetota bacterium]